MNALRGPRDFPDCFAGSWTLSREFYAWHVSGTVCTYIRMWRGINSRRWCGLACVSFEQLPCVRWAQLYGYNSEAFVVRKKMLKEGIGKLILAIVLCSEAQFYRVGLISNDRGLMIGRRCMGQWVTCILCILFWIILLYSKCIDCINIFLVSIFHNVLS